MPVAGKMTPDGPVVMFVLAHACVGPVKLAMHPESGPSIESEYVHTCGVSVKLSGGACTENHCDGTHVKSANIASLPSGLAASHVAPPCSSARFWTIIAAMIVVLPMLLTRTRCTRDDCRHRFVLVPTAHVRGRSTTSQ
jgi:hypothetical protein